MARQSRNAKVNATVNVTETTVAPVATVTTDIVRQEYGTAKELKFDFKPMTAAQIDKNIVALEGMGNKAAKLAHELVVASIRHYVAHGDYTKLAALFRAIKHGMGNSRVTALKAYVSRNVPSLMIGDAFKEGSKQVVGVELRHVKGQRRFIAEETNTAEKPTLAIPFWVDEKPEAAFDFDFATELGKLLKRALNANSTVVGIAAGKIKKQLGKVDVPSPKEIEAIAKQYKVKLDNDTAKAS